LGKPTGKGKASAHGRSHPNILRDVSNQKGKVSSLGGYKKVRAILPKPIKGSGVTGIKINHPQNKRKSKKEGGFRRTEERRKTRSP